jgi:hypothetical protein
LAVLKSFTCITKTKQCTTCGFTKKNTGLFYREKPLVPGKWSTQESMFDVMLFILLYYARNVIHMLQCFIFKGIIEASVLAIEKI